MTSNRGAWRHARVRFLLAGGFCLPLPFPVPPTPCPSSSLPFPLAPSPSLPAPWGQLWVMNTAAATQGQFPRCRGPAGAHKGNSPGATPPGGSAVSVLSTPSARRRSIHSVMCSKTSGLPWRGLIPNLTDWVVFLHPYPDSGLLLTLPRPRVADRGGRLWPGLGIYQY